MGFFNTLWAILQIVGSLGIFIYGMKMMSEGIQKLAGKRLRQILRGMTDHPAKGIFTGFVTTSLVQSSSATTVMVVSFVNAGLLTLLESFGIIMGANIGTTLTSWIVNYAGLKVRIAPIAVMLIGLAFPLLFSRRNDLKNLAEFVIGFGVLFIGLEFLKENVPDLSDPRNAGLLQFMNHFADLPFFVASLVFAALGALLTVVVQSSSASTAITLLMVANGWISFPLGAAMVLGENIGTTITANIAAIVANNNAKRAARFHFLFNMTGVVWMLIAMPWVIELIQRVPLEHRRTVLLEDVRVMPAVEATGRPDRLAGIADSLRGLTARQDTVALPGVIVMPDLNEEGKFVLLQGYDEFRAASDAELAAVELTVDSPNDRLPLFHTFFNVSNVLLLVWFMPFFSRMVYRMIPTTDDDEEETSLQYIVGGLMDTPELSIEEAKKETVQFGKLVQKMCSNIISLFFEQVKNPAKLTDKIRRREEITDQMEIEIANFLSAISEKDLSAASSHRIQSILSIINDLERMGDIFFRLSLAQGRMRQENIPFPEEVKSVLREYYDTVFARIKAMNQVLKGEFGEVDIEEANAMEDRINETRDRLNRKIFKSLEKGKINAVQSITFLNLIASAERIGDHVINVYEAMAGLK